MKIERITLYLVDRCLLVRVYTDEGITGTGEAGLWAFHRVVYEAINDLAEYFVAADAGAIEHHFQAVTRNAHFPGPVLSAALSAIDIALWDILGKSLGKPVHQLLGGACRQRLKVFSNITGDTVDEHVARARQAVDAGYASLRTMPFLSGWESRNSTRTIGTAVEIVRSIREEIGDDIDLGIEVHRNLQPDEAIILAHEIQPLRILYFEDPVAPESTVALQYVADHVDIPIAAGERSHNLFLFKELLDTRTVAMIRPDLSLAGGFTQCRKIAACAEAGFVGIFPHLMGSPVNVAAFVQFGASIPNYVLMENGAGPLDEIVDHAPVVVDGHLAVPDRPGIGLDLREEVLAKYPYRRHSITTARRGDGSVAH